MKKLKIGILEQEAFPIIMGALSNLLNTYL
jgi:hypothetical protein